MTKTVKAGLIDAVVKRSKSVAGNYRFDVRLKKGEPILKAEFNRNLWQSHLGPNWVFMFEFNVAKKKLMSYSETYAVRTASVLREVHATYFHRSENRYSYSRYDYLTNTIGHAPYRSKNGDVPESDIITWPDGSTSKCAYYRKEMRVGDYLILRHSTHDKKRLIFKTKSKAKYLRVLKTGNKYELGIYASLRYLVYVRDAKIVHNNSKINELMASITANAI